MIVPQSQANSKENPRRYLYDVVVVPEFPSIHTPLGCGNAPVVMQCAYLSTGLICNAYRRFITNQHHSPGRPIRLLKNHMNTPTETR